MLLILLDRKFIRKRAGNWRKFVQEDENSMNEVTARVRGGFLRVKHYGYYNESLHGKFNIFLLSLKRSKVGSKNMQDMSFVRNLSRF